MGEVIMGSRGGLLGVLGEIKAYSIQVYLSYIQHEL